MKHFLQLFSYGQQISLFAAFIVLFYYNALTPFYLYFLIIDLISIYSYYAFILVRLILCVGEFCIGTSSSLLLNVPEI